VVDLSKQFKVCVDGACPIVEDVVDFLSSETTKELDWEKLEEEVEEMEVFDGILFEGISIQRLL